MRENPVDALLEWVRAQQDNPRAQLRLSLKKAQALALELARLRKREALLDRRGERMRRAIRASDGEKGSENKAMAFVKALGQSASDARRWQKEAIVGRYLLAVTSPGGLSPREALAEIARAFHLSESTCRQRLVRAKRELKKAPSGPIAKRLSVVFRMPFRERFPIPSDRPRATRAGVT